MSGTSLNLVFLYARDKIENLILNTTLAVDLDMNGINKNNRVISLQTPGEPLLNIYPQILNHTTDASLTVLLALLLQMLRLSETG